MVETAPHREAVPSGYDRRVFINCPFDPAYRPMLDAVVFAVLVCGFTPCSALEIVGSDSTRIGKIMDLIASCRLGIHDISRVELNEENLPRFNMPLELGLWLGAGRFGCWPPPKRDCLVLDTERFRYQRFVSDIGGQDISAHANDPARAVRHVREFLQAQLSAEDDPLLPGGGDIARRFGAFQSALPVLCATQRLTLDELTYIDHARLALRWLARDAESG
jgi:hypothetical protein